MTLQQALDRIKRYSHRGDTATTSSDGGITQMILDSINDARRDVQAACPRRWQRKTGTVSLTSGTSTYSLPADTLEPYLYRFVINSSDYFLTKVEDEKVFYKELFSTGASNAIPKYVFDAGLDSSTPKQRQIIVTPTPDQSITLNVHYYKTWTTDELTTSDLASAIPEVPAHLHNAVWKGGLYYFLKAFDDPAQGLAKQDFAEALAQIEIVENLDLDETTAFKLGPMSAKKY